MRVRIIAALGVLAGTLILIIATLSVNGATLQSFQTLDQQARAQDKGVASTSAQPRANPRTIPPTPPRATPMSAKADNRTSRVVNTWYPSVIGNGSARLRAFGTSTSRAPGALRGHGLSVYYLLAGAGRAGAEAGR
jgi:hypothetical protein